MTGSEAFTDSLVAQAVERIRGGMAPTSAIASLIAAATGISDQLAGPDATRLVLLLAAQTHRSRASSGSAT